MRDSIRYVRFWKTADRSAGHAGCWPWNGSTDKDGYGRFGRTGTDRACRIAYQFLSGKIPSDMHVDHLCRNRSCVNPLHLEPVSPRQNTMRGNGPAAINFRKTKCINGHEFSTENTYYRADGARTCRTCNRERRRIRAQALSGTNKRPGARDNQSAEIPADSNGHWNG